MSTPQSPRHAGPLQDMVTTPERRSAYRKAGLWTDETLSRRLAANAGRAPDRVAVIDSATGRSSTYAELNRDADRVVGYLSAVLGVRPGDVVAVQLPNWYETVAVHLGVLRLGAVLNPMLPIYREREMAHMLATAATRVLITPATYRNHDHAAMAERLREAVPTLCHVLTVAPPGQPGSQPPFWAEADTAGASGQDACAVSELLFTSGTESTPKAIMHTEETAGAGVRLAAQALRISDGDVVWMPSPIGHSTGFNFGVRMAVHHGLPIVLQDRWDAQAAVALIARYRVSYTVAATTFLADLVRAAREKPVDLASLRLFCSGGAPVPAPLIEQAEAVGVPVLRLYGSTEVLVATVNRPRSPLAKRTGTDGYPLDSVEVEVRTDGRAARNEPGEIYVRSPSGCVGFFADPERTATTFDEQGWIATGDLGVLDHEGYLTIVGRRKEIIIRGGLNVAPRELEELIGELPQVSAVAVVPLPHARLGEIGCACVVLAAGAALTLDEVLVHLNVRGVARYKHPERLEILDKLPTTPTGKIQKHELVRALTG